MEEALMEDDLPKGVPTTKDGLVLARNLHLVDGQRLEFELVRNSVGPIFPVPDVRPIVSYALADSNLWASCAFRMAASEWRMKGLPIFGPNFAAALNEVIQGGIAKAKFALVDPDGVGDRGFAAQLMVFVSRVHEATGPGYYQVEAWEAVERAGTVSYIHALLDPELEHMTHLDGAHLRFEPAPFDNLFWNARKEKGATYQKRFRFDGKIPLDAAYEIIRLFLLVEELAREAFEMLVPSDEAS